MSRSIATIAELVWRQLNPKGKDEAKNTLEEYIERAKDEYANVAFTTWLQLRNDQDLSLIEQLLSRTKYAVKDGEMGLYSDLEVSVMDLPRDMGVFRVQAGKEVLTKTTLGTMNLFQDDPGERTYYRVGKQLFYPDGFADPKINKVLITLVSADFIDEEMDIPEILATPVMNALMKAYGTTENIKQDPSNDQNSDT